MKVFHYKFAYKFIIIINIILNYPELDYQQRNLLYMNDIVNIAQLSQWKWGSIWCSRRRIQFHSRRILSGLFQSYSITLKMIQ